MSILLEQHAVNENGNYAIDFALGKNFKSEHLTNEKGKPISMKKVINSLPEVTEMVWVGENFVEVKTKAYWFIRSDDPSVLKLYGEPYGDDKTFTGCCYYGNEAWCISEGDNGRGYPNIRKVLVEWASERGWHFEFDDAGSASLWC